MATKHPKGWDEKYTDPDLRARLKDEVQADDKGGKPGQWSARKAQLLKAAYEREGGGYLGEKDETQQHLSQWSQEDWQTSDGSADATTGSSKERGGASKRYLPKEAWDELSEDEKRATDTPVGGLSSAPSSGCWASCAEERDASESPSARPTRFRTSKRIVIVLRNCRVLSRTVC